MSRRFKSSIPGPSFPRHVGPAGEARIENGETWLRVWSQQLAIPLSIIARKTKIDLGRLIQIETGGQATEDELAAIAATLQTEVRLILESQNVQSL
jgi:hypothetical protein